MEKWVQTSDFKVKRDDVVLRIGDYINYHDCAGKNDTDLYKGRWQVLGADDTGNLLIVSESNVTTHHFNKGNTLEGAMKAYSTGAETLNKICEVYGKGTGATGARSICIEDVDRLTGYDVSGDYNNYGKGYNLKNQKGNAFTWHDGTCWHKIKSSKSICLVDTYYQYDVSNKMDVHLLDLLIEEENPKVFDMLFGKKNQKHYWLASTFVGANSDFACFGFRYVQYASVLGEWFVNLFGDYRSYQDGVRAVVTLEPNIKITPKEVIVNEWEI